MTQDALARTAPAGLAARWWPLALLAIAAPTLIAAHDPPSVTFYNQALAVLGWGLLIAMMAAAPLPPGARAGGAVRALLGVLGMHAALAAWAALGGPLPAGLAMMGAGLGLAALFAVWAGWRGGRSTAGELAADVFFGALAAAGAIGIALAAVQVFHPAWADGRLLAAPVVAGRAVGNLRQPNHFSTLLVWGCCAAVWLSQRRRLPEGVCAALVALFIGGVVWTASRTGMVGMVFLCLWGLLDRNLSRRMRVVVAGAPVWYAAWWGLMWAWSHLDGGVAFAAEARLHDGSDISSSRFAIWSNVLSLIRMHPWTGVGFGEFNVAWTFTPFPDRPVAFFDHTHNLLLQWAVEFGVPLALLMTGLCLWAFVALFRRPARKAISAPSPAPAAAVIVALAGLHSLLEYPLWYSYFLLPAAFAWGLGLGAREAACDLDTASSGAPATGRLGAHALTAAGLLTALGAVWCAVDYQSAANIYAPRAGAGPLADRVARGQRMPWFGYQADYAAVTTADGDEPSLPPAAFRRTLHNLVDARLMIAYARSLAEHGQVDQARYVVARLKEFRNPMTRSFMAPCDTEPEDDEPLPFQCTPPAHDYTWRQLLPR
ncbi:PglL family O-oligosaccharyltransferase [Aquabacterium olei]|nr:O-antigen ligase family protein [Aquabacterium olei]